ncbi:MAG TPA: hypothetical protein VH374_21060 [Polyangia bacterium]|nr:hypothetical protein [Polyangia bacterium]
MIRAVVAAAAVAAVCGCVPTAAPLLPQDVASALAKGPMRTLTTPHLIVYYSEGNHDQAVRLAAHAEGCVGYLKSVAQIHNDLTEQPMAVLFADLPLNNAFVTPRILGWDAQAVISTHDTVDLFSLEMGQPPDAGETACHELVHYVHLEQIAGFPLFMNTVFGAAYTPQIGLDSWFDEGLAVYYETKLQPGTGRLAWPFWRGMFAAAYAGHRINGGDLSALQRDFHLGNHYLVGSQFVRFLADRYGEQQLWRLINVQGRSIFFPFGVNLRFWQAYDKTLSTLVDEFADEVAQHIPPRARPAGQRVVHAAGYSARYARAADGTEAIVSSDHDQPARLKIYAPDGALRVVRDLTDVLPPRELVAGVPSFISGVSFSSDGRTLYFVSTDQDATYQASRLYRYDVADDSLSVVNRDLRGPGGSISPDGRRYAFAQANADHHDLALLDLASGQTRVLFTEPSGTYLSNPRFSPDGKRLVATEADHQHFRLRLFDAASGQPQATLPTADAPVHDPSWADDQRILYLGPAPTTAGFQVYVHDLASARTERVTDAPYLAFEPRAAGAGAVRFLNRNGWEWTVDEVKLPPPQPALAVAAADAAPAPSPPSPPPAVIPAPPAAASPALPVELAATPDQPYSSFGDLFTPRLHGLTLTSVGRRADIVGVVLSGNDRLALHRWTIAGYLEPSALGQPSVLFGYTNRQLAPLTISLSASQFTFHDSLDPLSANNATFDLYRRDRNAALDFSRAFYENPITLGIAYLDTNRPGDPDAPLAFRRMAGPHLDAVFVGAETTPYTGARRLFAAAASVAGYPRQWNTTGDSFLDARGELDAVVPLPLGHRHTLTLGLRGRDLPGTTQPFLTVGGYINAVLGRRSNRPEVKTDDSPAIPPGFDFTEALRGFEDYPFAANRVVLGDATYRYPLIIDRGWSSSLWVLPAFFISQIDLELFGAGARAQDNRDRLAVGGALTLRTTLWVVPLNLQYQLARRLTDDRALTHLITLGN